MTGSSVYVVASASAALASLLPGPTPTRRLQKRVLGGRTLEFGRIKVVEIGWDKAAGDKAKESEFSFFLFSLFFSFHTKYCDGVKGIFRCRVCPWNRKTLATVVSLLWVTHPSTI